MWNELANGFWNLNILRLYSEFLKISNTNFFLIMSVFHMWMGGYHRYKFFNQNFFNKKVLSLMLYKIDFVVLKFKSCLLKPKLNLLKKKIEFFSIHINHLAQIYLMNMTLMSYLCLSKLIIFWSFDMVFGTFDCDHT
jgi:hypothetical protein